MRLTNSKKLERALLSIQRKTRNLKRLHPNCFSSFDLRKYLPDFQESDMEGSYQRYNLSPFDVPLFREMVAFSEEFLTTKIHQEDIRLIWYGHSKAVSCHTPPHVSTASWQPSVSNLLQVCTLPRSYHQ